MLQGGSGPVWVCNEIFLLLAAEGCGELQGGSGPGWVCNDLMEVQLAGREGSQGVRAWLGLL